MNYFITLAGEFIITLSQKIDPGALRSERLAWHFCSYLVDCAVIDIFFTYVWCVSFICVSIQVRKKSVFMTINISYKLRKWKWFIFSVYLFRLPVWMNQCAWVHTHVTVVCVIIPSVTPVKTTRNPKVQNEYKKDVSFKITVWKMWNENHCPNIFCVQRLGEGGKRNFWISWG